MFSQSMWETNDFDDIDCDEYQCMKPMIDLLKYYATLNMIDNAKHKEDLVKYCSETYKSLLQDYVHIIDHHNNDIEGIYEMMMTKYEFIPCDMNNCSCLLRHHRSRYKDEYDDVKAADIADNFIFYRDIIDAMHCYLLHSYDTGMRVKMDNNIQTDLDNLVDSVYLRIVTIINEKKKKLKKIHGFNHNRFETNKFNVNRSKADNETDGDTFSDGLYTFLMEIGQIEEKEIYSIQKNLADDEYDSEALEQDIQFQNSNGQGKQSNICINMKAHYDLFNRYVYLNKLAEHTFASGFRFWYWNSTENSVIDRTGGSNINHLSGYQQSDLYVEKKYDSMKEELTQNEIYPLKIHQFNMSVNKANQYLELDKVKSTKVNNRDASDYLIADDAILSFSNILSVIFYTDWDELCSAFSATFRKTKLYEPISCVIRRNQEYANWSRILRETVECFGANPWEKRSIMEHDKINPLFCGMSFVMVMPEVHMRFAGPTSTSGNLEVAQSFAGDDGIVIQLNTGYTYHDLAIRSFCCNWISNYSSENEYLFCGGKWRVRIETVIIQSTKQNFHECFESLFYLECMLNGSKVYGADITETNYLTLNNLIKHKLKINGFKNKYPQYINNTFDAYTNEKTQIVLNLHWISKVFEDLKSLILYTKADTEQKRYEYRYNLFKPVLLQLFPNVTDITMYCAHGVWQRNEYYQYPLNLQQIIGILQSAPSLMKDNLEINIKAVHPYDLFGTFEVGYSWIMQLFEEEVEEEFVTANLLAYIVQTSYGEDRYIISRDGYRMLIPKKNQDCLIIKKAHQFRKKL